MIKLIIFDLDGTLLDTLEDLAYSTNTVLQERGYPVHNREAYKTFVGNGALKLIERAVEGQEVSEQIIVAIKEDFIQHYDTHLLKYVKPYQGIVQLLNQLQEKGILLAVATNKPHIQAVKLVNYCFEDIKFVDVVGNQAHLPHKPDPFVIHEIIQLAGVHEDEVLYVGDSDVDMQTAINAQVKGIGVSWGFRSTAELYEHGAHCVINHADELLGYI